MGDSSSAELLECGSCGNLGFGQGGMVCCDSAMEPVDGDGDGVTRPSFEELVRTVFDMSETELDICLCVMEGGDRTVAELAREVEYDRSVVSRHLNHLVDLGVVDRHRRLLEEGGQVYVYTPNEPDVVRRNLAGAFVAWVRDATSLIESLRREKVEAMVEDNARDPQWEIYRE
jgi:predicted transcriptional regulator